MPVNEVKMPKRPILTYYIIILACIFLFNGLLMPMFRESEVKEVDYSAFMTMTEENSISKVEIEENQILFKKREMTRPPIKRPAWMTRR